MGDVHVPQDDDGMRQHHVFAAVYHLVKVLESDTNIPDDMRKVIENLDVHFSAVVKLDEEDDHKVIEDRLVSARDTIMRLHAAYSNIWDSDPCVASDYLKAVAEVEAAIGSLEGKPIRRGSKRKALYDEAQSVREIAMERLQKELLHILVQNKQCFFEQDIGTPSTVEPNPGYEDSFVSVVSNEDESMNVSRRESSSTETEEYAMDLIHPDVIPQIKSIADAMILAGYGPEFRRVFTGFWRDTSAEFLTMHMDHFSIDDVLRMDWKRLNLQIKIWCYTMRRFIGAYLGSSKRLFNQILGRQCRASSDCLIDAAKPSVMRLLNFGTAVSIAPHRPEWLSCLLNMYEILQKLLPDVESLFPEESSLIRMEFHELLIKLGNSAKTIFEEIGTYIAQCHTTTPSPVGHIPHLTKYVMNYILLVADFGDTLNSLLQENNGDNSQPTNGDDDVPCIVAMRLKSWTSILEETLYKKANFYSELPLKHIFMMNNIHYMVRKINRSKAGPYFGDDWIRSHMVKYRQHAIYYERETWGEILPLLHEDSKAGKATLKARCRDFASAFEDLYKNQTRWFVPDYNLREELRISTSKTVILAYRSFVNRINTIIGEKYIKYSEQHLENYILDLLEGLPKSLNHSRKK